jgi:micrococcal nuclease
MPKPKPASPPDPKASLYHYRATVTSVYDGDTCTVDIDLGLRTWVRGEKLRLTRINAPELRGAERARGLKSRDHLRGLVLGREVLLMTIKDRREKYGRYLAEIWLAGADGALQNVNDLMVEAGHAKYQRY